MGSSCPACGYDNPLGANFCSSCGDELRAITDSETERIAMSETGEALGADRPESPVLLVRQGPKRGSRIALDSDLITIGRQEDSDIFLDDITVSRDHATLERSLAGFTVTDNGSLNGTYVNKQLVETVELVDGDELQVGKFKMVYLALGAQR